MRSFLVPVRAAGAIETSKCRYDDLISTYRCMSDHIYSRFSHISVNIYCPNDKNKHFFSIVLFCNSRPKKKRLKNTHLPIYS